MDAWNGMQTRREPKIEITKCDPTKTIFVLSDSDVSFANALRRVMISEVGDGGANQLVLAAPAPRRREGDLFVRVSLGAYSTRHGVCLRRTCLHRVDTTHRSLARLRSPRWPLKRSSSKPTTRCCMTSSSRIGWASFHSTRADVNTYKTRQVSAAVCLVRSSSNPPLTLGL